MQRSGKSNRRRAGPTRRSRPRPRRNQAVSYSTRRCSTFAATQNALVIPVASLNEKSEVRVLQGDGTIAVRKVETGARTRFLSEVTSGLVGGERIITGVKASGPLAKLRVES